MVSLNLATTFADMVVNMCQMLGAKHENVKYYQRMAS